MHEARERRTGRLKLVRLSPRERLLKDIIITKNKCWQLTKFLTIRGYGRIAVKDKSILAHRYSYKIFKGNIPKKLLVCHSCDNPKCINPDHLWLGTNADNALDKSQKKRGNQPSGKRKAKLNKEQVKNIKKMLKNGSSYKEITKKYNLTSHSVYNIKVKKTWKNI